MATPITHKLTPKQEMFCCEYLVDLNATQAAIRAGYSAKTAGSMSVKLVAKSAIQRRIRELRVEREKRVSVTADYVLISIVDTMERCKQAEPVLDKDGLPTGEFKFDSGAVLKGAELLGKHLAMWTDRQRIEDPDGNALPVLKLVVQKGGDGEPP